jgi:hypothetical protein
MTKFLKIALLIFAVLMLTSSVEAQVVGCPDDCCTAKQTVGGYLPTVPPGYVPPSGFTEARRGHHGHQAGPCGVGGCPKVCNQMYACPGCRTRPCCCAQVSRTPCCCPRCGRNPCCCPVWFCQRCGCNPCCCCRIVYYRPVYRPCWYPGKLLFGVFRRRCG